MTKVKISGTTWCWRRSENTDIDDKSHYLSQYVEANGKHLRKKYLEFIYELGQVKVNGRTIVEHLEVGSGLSFWWMTLLVEKSPYKSSRIQDCLKLFALAEILEGYSPEVIDLYDVHDGHIEESIRTLCSNLSIQVVLHSQQASKRRVYFPHGLQGTAWLIRHLFHRWSLKELSSPFWFSGNRAVFFFSYFIHLDPSNCSKGQFFSHQWAVLPRLFRELGYQANWVHHFLFSKQVPDTATAVDWVGGFNASSKEESIHSFLDSYLSIPVVIRAIVNWLRLIGVSIRLRRINLSFSANNSVVSLWPLLKDDWYGSIRGKVAIQNSLWAELFDQILGSMPKQQLGLYLYEGQGWEHAFVNAWRKHGHGELIAVAHSTVRFWDLRYFNDLRTILDKKPLAMPQPDRTALNGPVALRAFIDADYPPDRFVTVEAVRYLNLDGRPKQKDMLIGHSKKDLRRLLVLGDIMPVLTRMMMEVIVSIPESILEEFEVVVKPHPGNLVVKEHYPKLQFELTYEPLHKILHQFDIVIGANPSSATLDAYLTGLPVIVYLPTGDLNLSPLRGVEGVYFVSDCEALISTLRNSYVKEDYLLDRFFWLDNDLPMWRFVIESALEEKI